MDERLPRWQGWLSALLVSLVAWALLIRACTSWPPPPAPAVVAEEILPPERTLAAWIAPEAPRVTGMVRPLHGKTPCAGWSPLPFVVADPRPRVGRPWRCSFLSSACPVPAEPDLPMWILASFREPPDTYPLDLGKYGFKGCWLHLQPDFVIPSWPAVEGDEQDGLLVRSPERGRTVLTWTPPAGTAGMRMWLQLVVAGRQGFAVSHAIRVTIGS